MDVTSRVNDTWFTRHTAVFHGCKFGGRWSFFNFFATFMTCWFLGGWLSLSLSPSPFYTHIHSYIHTQTNILCCSATRALRHSKQGKKNKGCRSKSLCHQGRTVMCDTTMPEKSLVFSIEPKMRQQPGSKLGVQLALLTLFLHTSSFSKTNNNTTQ